MEIHGDVFDQLCRFQKAGRLYMLYGNHDMEKSSKSSFTAPPYYEAIIFKSELLPKDLYVTHGHQADWLNSVAWKLARFLVHHLWSPLENFGFLDPTSAAKNNTKKEKLEKRYIHYARQNNCLLLTGHTHRPTLGDAYTPYYNCGSCVHPRCITCIELCGFDISLVKWYCSTEKSGHFGNIYGLCPPSFPVYIKREVMASQNLLEKTPLSRNLPT